jgi:protein ImuB
LLVDITGCGPCFHGEDNLLHRARREFTEAGWVPRIAIADSVGAAWALAHFEQTPFLLPPGAAATALRDLPPAALRLPAQALADFAQLGIDRIGALLDLPRSGLPARFGPTVLKRIDQALGRQPEFIVPNRTPGEIQASQLFEYPTDCWNVLNYVVDRLTERIRQQLQKRNLAARKLEIWFYQIAEAPLRIEVGLYRPSNCSDYLAMLLHARLERARIHEPIRALRLQVTATALLRDHQREFFQAGEKHGIEEASTLVDCLSSRLGTRAVTRARLVEDYQPEHAYRFEPLIQPETAGTAAPPVRSTKTKRRPQKDRWQASIPAWRPLQLWGRPVEIQVISAVPDGPPFQLRWGGQDYRVLRCWGPERIATGWWRGQDIERDYYVVATDRGTRLWIFRSNGHWFLHGCFD